jgi:hypothetical protein
LWYGTFLVDVSGVLTVAMTGKRMDPVALVVDWSLWTVVWTTTYVWTRLLFYERTIFYRRLMDALSGEDPRDPGIFGP